MAFSSTRQRRELFGGLAVEIYEVDFASVTAGTVVSGLKKIFHAQYTPETTDDHGVVNKNSASASATEDDLGSCHISGVTSSDTGTLILFGLA